MVAAGLGLTILPELFLQDRTHPVRVLPIDPPFHRTLGIGVPKLKDASPAAVRFIRLVRDMLEDKTSVLLP